MSRDKGKPSAHSFAARRPEYAESGTLCDASGATVKPIMEKKRTSREALDELWESTPAGSALFDPAALDARNLPEAARRCLKHAVAPGTPLARAVRLRMHGEFRMKQWYPFAAEQVIRGDGQMLWQARIGYHGLPITGFDSVLGGEGAMQWKLLGFLPLAEVSGPQVTRSAIGRIEGESLWLPSLLCGEDVAWSADNSSQVHARFGMRGEKADLSLEIAEGGGIKSILYPRWGNPEGEAFHYAPFGGIVEAEGTFGGYTIPTCLRVGWYFGTPRFESEGEFFRVTIDDARYR